MHKMESGLCVEEEPALRVSSLLCPSSFLAYYILYLYIWSTMVGVPFPIRGCEALSAGLGSASCCIWPMSLVGTWADSSSSGKENLVPQGILWKSALFLRYLMQLLMNHEIPNFQLLDIRCHIIEEAVKMLPSRYFLVTICSTNIDGRRTKRQFNYEC
jgi:hypothetical protein